MLPAQHSHIRHSSEYHSSSHSDLQSLNNLRNMLPSHHPISVMDDYLIEPNQSNQPHYGEGEEVSFGEENELMLKIAEQAHLIIKMQEELYYFRSQFFKIANENQRYLETLRQFEQLEDKLLQLNRQQEQKLREEEAGRLERDRRDELKQSEIEALMQLKDKELKELKQLKDNEIKALKQANSREMEALRIGNNREIEALHQLKNRQIKALNQLKERQIEALKKELCILKQSQGDSDHLLRNKLTDQLRFQERIILELSMKNENIMKINFLLKEELRIAENKLIQLQNQMQQKLFGNLSQNLVRLKENHNLINKKPNYSQNKPRQRNHLPSQFEQQADQDTIKLTSRRESGPGLREDRYHREVKTVEKQRQGYSPLIDKLKPLEQPKPQRKFYRAVDIQPVKKFKRNISPREFFS